MDTWVDLPKEKAASVRSVDEFVEMVMAEAKVRGLDLSQGGFVQASLPSPPRWSKRLQ